MTDMEILLRFIILITLSLLGGLLYAVVMNLMIFTHLIDTSELYGNFGQDITNKTVMVWIVCIILGICSVFMEKKWRYALLLSPLFTPSIFAFFYALIVL
jgi:predicted membrane protein